MAERQSATIEVDASVEELFEIVCDLEAYQDWVEGLESVEILDTDSEGRPARVEMLVDAGIKKVRYVLSYDYDAPHEMSWVSEPGGDVKHIEGSYRFEMADDGGTMVVYELAVDTGFPVPGFLKRTAEKRIIGAALDGLKQRAEEG